MSRYLITFLWSMFTILSCHSHAASPFESTKNLPNLYQGRFRSLDSTAQMWLYDLSHKRKMDDTPALDVLWDIHLRGASDWNETPLFWIHYAKTKSLLGLDTRRERFSFQELTKVIQQLGPTQREDSEITDLIQRLNSYAEDVRTELRIDKNTSTPMIQYLQKIGTTLRMLPARGQPGTWISLRALEVEVYDSTQSTAAPIGNFTEFTDQQFEAIRGAYKALKKEALLGSKEVTQAAHVFAEEYEKAYQHLEGTAYRKASGKSLTYPKNSVLALETFYYRTPLIEAAIALYIIALFAFLLGPKARAFGWIFLLTALALHTFALGLRSFILARPPVTNMFETVIYVPWITVILAVVVALWQQSKSLIIAGCLAAIVLLSLLKISDLDARMENVQAVLDSQFWLIIHVLMVVGSYGAFVLSGVLGHVYLAKEAMGATQEKGPLARGILTTMYIGVGLLIPGTILGGIWAAQSWGRFWDWDPKESWAFISACVYLIVIHAYTFRKVGDLGLAVGSVLGLISISFTWYGVNYVLGTGLHSYGFGSGTPLYYFGYLLAEAAFICGCLLVSQRRKRSIL